MLTVMMNHIDDNNNYAIFNLVLHYIIIKNENVNIIWIFICFFLNLVSYLKESCSFFFKINWCQTVSNSIKYGSKLCDLFFANGRRAYYIQQLLCFKKCFLIIGIKYSIPYHTDSMIHISY